MMSFGGEQFDMMIRGGSLSLLSLLVGLLWHRHRDAVAGRLAILLLVLVGCHVLATMTPSLSLKQPVGVAIAVGATLVPVGFWLFARCWFNDKARIGRIGWTIAGAAIFLASAHMVMRQADSGPPYWMQVMLRLMMIGFACAGLWEAWRGRTDDLVEARRRLRSVLIWTVGLFALATNAVEILSNQGVFPDAVRLFVEIGILILCLGFSLALLDLRNTDLFGKVQHSTDETAPTPVDTQAAARLNSFMLAEKAWRDEQLSIAKLAALLGEQEYRLRQLINRQLGYRNFAAFLSHYRLDEVRAALADPEQKEVPISTIALDAGFGSLGPFNRVFREAEGITPSEYRSRHAG